MRHCSGRTPAPRNAATGLRDITLDRGEFERQRRNRLRQPGERLGLEALDVDLDEGRRAVPRDQRVERGHRDPDALAPDLALPAGRALRRLHEIARGGRDRGIVDVDREFDLARRGADRDRLDGDARVAPVDQPQRLHQRRLRLAGDDTASEPAERRDAVADMRADVEHQIARLHEPRIKPVHRGAIMCRHNRSAASAGRRAVCEMRRARLTPRAAPPPRPRAARAASGAGGAVSSGSAPMPARIIARPTPGHEVTTASGIDSAGPAAMNSA